MGIENRFFNEDSLEDDEDLNFEDMRDFSENLAEKAGVDFSKLKQEASKQNRLLREGLERLRQQQDSIQDQLNQEDLDEWDQSFRNLSNQPK